MLRGISCCLLAGLAFAQTPPAPIDAAIQAYQTAHQEGRFDEAAARREEALGLLNATPADTPQFGMWVQTIASIYAGAGRTEQARTTILSSLARLSPSDVLRVVLLDRVSDFWYTDGNLLEALKYREQAAAAAESAKPVAPSANGNTRLAYSIGISWLQSPGDFSPNTRTYHYQRLADLYLELGRREAGASIIEKIAALSGVDQSTAASLYEREGRLDKAEELFRSQTDRALAQSDPYQIAGTVQNLAFFYQRQKRYTDAAAILEKGIAATGSDPKLRDQSNSLRQTLATVLRQSGNSEGAANVDRQLFLANPDDSGAIGRYANQLAAEHHAEQAEELLNGFLTAHSNLQPWEEANILQSLSNIARTNGQPQRADELARAAQEKGSPPPAQPQIIIGEDLQQANIAMNQRRFDDAFRFAAHAIAQSGRAADRDQITNTVLRLASELETASPERSGQLMRQLFETLESWAVDSPGPLLNALHTHVTLIAHKKDRSGDVPAAIERFRSAAVAAHGAKSEAAADALRFRIAFEQTRESPEQALASSKDLLDLEESLSGPIHQRYLDAMEQHAQLYESVHDRKSQIEALRQAVSIADKLYVSPNFRNGNLRMTAAFALAREGQFEEAEQLASQALAIGARLDQPQPFQGQAEQIRKMRVTAQLK